MATALGGIGTLSGVSRVLTGNVDLFDAISTEVGGPNYVAALIERDIGNGAVNGHYGAEAGPPAGQRRELTQVPQKEYETLPPA